MLVLPAVICIAMFEGELTGALIGVFGGLLCDLSSGLIYGFNGLLFLLFCAAAGLLILHLMRLTLTNALIFSLVALAVRDLLEFYFLYILWGYEGSSIIFLRKFCLCLLLPSLLFPLLLACAKIKTGGICCWKNSEFLVTPPSGMGRRLSFI